MRYGLMFRALPLGHYKCLLYVYSKGSAPGRRPPLEAWRKGRFGGLEASKQPNMTMDYRDYSLQLHLLSGLPHSAR